MTLFQFIIDLLLIFIFPVMIGLSYAVFHLVIQRMPSFQREALKYFAHIAVSSIEHDFPSHASSDIQTKETLAKTKVLALFGAFHLPCPTDTTLEIAVKSSLFELAMKKKA